MMPISFHPLPLQLFNGRCHVLVPARIIDGWSFEPESKLLQSNFLYGNLNLVVCQNSINAGC